MDFEEFWNDPGTVEHRSTHSPEFWLTEDGDWIHRDDIRHLFAFIRSKLLPASIADTAVLQDLGYELGCPAGIKTIDWLRVMVRKAQRAEVSSIADTAGAKCGTCGAVGTVTSTKARCTLCGMFADTAGANPVTGPWPTDAMNAAGMRELAAFHKSRGDTVDAIYLAMSAAAPDTTPAPSVADARKWELLKNVYDCGEAFDLGVKAARGEV